jgi:hypothetical protein
MGVVYIYKALDFYDIINKIYNRSMEENKQRSITEKAKIDMS